LQISQKEDDTIGI